MNQHGEDCGHWSLAASSLGLDGDAAKWLKLWLHWATYASREVCRPDVWNGFYSYSSTFSRFIIHLHQTSDWRLYFISAVLEKYLSTRVRSTSYIVVPVCLSSLRLWLRFWSYEQNRPFDLNEWTLFKYIRMPLWDVFYILIIHQYIMK